MAGLTSSCGLHVQALDSATRHPLTTGYYQWCLYAALHAAPTLIFLGIGIDRAEISVESWSTQITKFSTRENKFWKMNIPTYTIIFYMYLIISIFRYYCYSIWQIKSVLFCVLTKSRSLSCTVDMMLTVIVCMFAVDIIILVLWYISTHVVTEAVLPPVVLLWLCVCARMYCVMFSGWRDYDIRALWSFMKLRCLLMKCVL